MPFIPSSVAETDLSREIQKHLPLHHRGKVRDTYLVDGRYRLVVTTDRISGFDVVLGQLVPDKGKVLHAINVHWRRQFRDVPNDLVAAGSRIDAFLPAGLKGNRELQSRAVVADNLEMFLGELIVRGILTGTALKMYKAGERSLWGYPPLPEGMKEWDDLPYSMFTPTNKADSGHDEPVTRESVGAELEEFAIKLFEQGREMARERGLVMVDTKFEVGHDRFGELTLADEVFTPDASRYLHLAEFEEDRRLGRKPRSFDKQVVREWLMKAELPSGDVIDVSKLDPNDPQDRDLAASLVMPEEVMEATRERYFELLRMLTGHTLESFQREELDIAS